MSAARPLQRLLISLRQQIKSGLPKGKSDYLQSVVRHAMTDNDGSPFLLYLTNLGFCSAMEKSPEGRECEEVSVG